VQRISLGGIDYAILIIYFVFVLGIGWALRRRIRSSEDFFLSGRSIPHGSPAWRLSPRIWARKKSSGWRRRAPSTAS